MKKITDYKPLQRNPNKGTQKGAGIIDESVRTLGAGRSLLVDKDGVIIAGNHAQEAFVNAGMENVIEVETDGTQIVVVKRTDMTADSVAGKEMAIMDNRASELGLAWDEVILEEMMEEISAEDGQLDKFLEDLAKDEDIELESNAGADTEPEIDKAEELRVKWGVELGQMWRLGDHRIICGDCTDRAVVERLMAGEKADMCHTDPPYNVDYGASKNPRHKIRSIENDSLSKSDWEDFVLAFGTLIKEYTLGDCYIWGASAPDGMKMRLIMCEDLGMHWSATIVWKKQQLVLSPAKYQRMYEPCLYGWFGERSSFVADRKQTEVWCVDRPHDSKLHPTMKPIELCEIAITNSSNKNDKVLELFSGSGSTLVACENLHRQCRAVEISPAYVAVSIERWHQHTGLMPELME